MWKSGRGKELTDHLHPESCAGRCEAAGEALTGARHGQGHRASKGCMSGVPRPCPWLKATPPSPRLVRGWRTPRCRRTHARSYVQFRRDLGGLHSAPAVEPGPQREGGFRIRWCTGMKKSDEAGCTDRQAGEQGSEERLRSCSEGRASTKGNSQDQSIVPDAGSGGRVTGGRADTASCNEKAAGETDCALDDHITTDALRCAFYDLKKTASAGVDESGVDGVRSRRTGRAAARPARPRTLG